MSRWRWLLVIDGRRGHLAGESAPRVRVFNEPNDERQVCRARPRRRCERSERVACSLKGGRDRVSLLLDDLHAICGQESQAAASCRRATAQCHCDADRERCQGVGSSGFGELRTSEHLTGEQSRVQGVTERAGLARGSIQAARRRGIRVRTDGSAQERPARGAQRQVAQLHRCCWPPIRSNRCELE